MNIYIVLIFAFFAILFRLFQNGPLIEPVAYNDPPLPFLEVNSKLLEVEHLFEGKIVAPEAFAVDKDGLIYTGLVDGRIIRFHPNAESFELFARTGPALPSCGSLHMEPVCGRPLSMQFHSSGALIVADAYKGLLSIEPDGKTRVLAVEADGQKFILLNGLAISDDGINIYFTETSSKYSRRDIILEVLEGQPTGRLMVYSMTTQEVRVLLKDLPFPNGICFTHDKKEILIVSTSRFLVTAYNLQTGTERVFTENLPGVPDNVQPHPSRPTYLLGMGSKRCQPFSFLHSLGPYPQVKKFLVRLLPIEWILKLMPNYGMLAELNEKGEVVDTFQDPSGRTPWISEVHVEGGYIFFGSWRNAFLGRLNATNLWNTPAVKSQKSKKQKKSK